MTTLIRIALLVAALTPAALGQYPPPAGLDGNNYRVQAVATAPGEFEVWWIASDPDYKCIVQTYRRFSGMWILRETEDCGTPSLPVESVMLAQNFENPFDFLSPKPLNAPISLRAYVEAATTSPADNKLYLIEYFGNDRIRVIDTLTFKQAASIDIAPSPQAVALTLGGTLLFVSHFSPPALTIISTETNSIAATLPMPENTRPKWMAMAPDRATLYIGNNGTVIDGKNTSSILIFDIPSRTITGTILPPQPTGCFDRLALSNDGNLLYARQTCGSPFGTVVIDTTAREVVTTISHGTQGQGLAVHPTGRRVYSSSFRGIEIIDAISNTVLGFVPLPASAIVQAIAVSFDGSTVVAADGKNGTLITIDGTTDAFVSETPVNVGTGELFHRAGTQ